MRQPFDVYCDMEMDGGGWTVFQCRINGSQDFYLDWEDYENGFGDLNGEFWLGPRKLHRLTANTSQANTLRVDLGDFDANTAYAKYSTFRIGDSVSKYTLTVSGYTGTAGDSLDYHGGRPFTTRDRDNDGTDSRNCAEAYKGAWWYYDCYRSSLNGLYHHSGPQTSGDTVSWNLWRSTYSLKTTEMKLRRA